MINRSIQQAIAEKIGKKLAGLAGKKLADKKLAKSKSWERASHKPGSVLLGAEHLRGRLSIWDACHQAPLAVLTVGTGKRPTIVPITLLPTGVYRASASRRCWCALTAPLHPYQSAKGWIGGMFLWHYPHGRPHWALSSKSGLSGARTFLKQDPCLQPPTPTLSLFYFTILEPYRPADQRLYGSTVIVVLKRF